MGTRCELRPCARSSFAPGERRVGASASGQPPSLWVWKGP
jgi:hypothetical protein